MIEKLTKNSSSFTQFFLLAASIFTILTIILVFITNSIIKNSFINRAKVRVGDDIQLVAKDLRAEDFSLRDPSHVRGVFSTFYQKIKTTEIIRIKVWDYSGKVIFSDDASIVGQRFPDNEEFKQALLGEVVTEIGQKVKPENISEMGYEQLLEVYVPITFSGESVPSGVIEAYFRLDDVNDRIREAQRILFLAITSFTAVSGILFYILFKNTVYQQTKFLRQIIDTNPNLIFTKDRDGKFTLVNQAVAEIYGTTIDDLVGKRDADFNPNQDEVHHFLADDRDVLETHKTKIIPEEPVTQAKTEQVRWFQTIKVPLLTHGKILQVLGVSTEITERKKAEEQMRLQTAALEAAASSVVITDTQGTIQWVNPAFTTLTGYTSSEAIGQSTRMLYSGKQDKAFYQNMWNTILTGQVWHGELVNRRKDGSLYVEEQIITPVKNEQGEIAHFIAIKQDVTNRQQTEETLKQLNDKLEDAQKAVVNVLEDLRLEKANTEKEKAKDEAILASIGDGMIATDQHTKVIFVNDAIEKLVGWKREEVIGKSWFEVIPMEDKNGNSIPDDERPIHTAISLKKTTTTTTTGTEYYFVRKDKSRFPVAITATPIILNGEVIGAIGIYRDITHEKAIDKAKTEFVSLASHQLRTPLSTINWYSEMLITGDAGKLNQEQIQYVNEVYRGSQRMVELVNALLQVSRLELGTFTIEPQRVILSEIGRSVLDELKPQILAKKITVSENYQADVNAIQADPKLLRIILQNLVSNAVKYTPEQGSIQLEISTEAQGDASIKITDTGFGIPMSQKSHIFTKLFRADNVKERDTEGTGLGLYIVKSILDQSGGKIWFKSVENQGTTFYVSLPRSGIGKKEGTRQLA